MRLTSHFLVTSLLLTAPLSAQQTVVVPDVNVSVENFLDSIALTVTIEREGRDSAEVARDEAAQRAMETIADYLENCGCVNGGGSSTTVQLATAGIVFALGLIWWELRKGNADGVDGAPGQDGSNGTNGVDGVDGQDGTNGVDGADGQDGVDGQDGKDHGEGR